MAYPDEFILLTAVIPVLNPERHINGLRKMQDESNQIGIRTIFVIDSYKALSLDDKAAVKLLKDNSDFLSTIIEGSYGNPGDARNAALNSIETPWLTFWDADDTPYPSQYLQNVKLFPSADLIVGGYEVTNGQSEDKFFTNSLAELAFNPGIWRIIFKLDLFEGKRFPSLSMGEDQLLLVDLDLGIRRINYVNNSFYKYQTGIEGQLTKSKTALMDLEKSLTISRMLIEMSAENIYKRVIAVRLLITFLKQEDYKFRVKTLTILNYISKDYLKALIIILIRKMRNHD